MGNLDALVGAAMQQQQLAVAQPMNDAQILAFMAAMKGGEPADAADWAFQTLAEVIIRMQRNELGRCVQMLAPSNGIIH